MSDSGAFTLPPPQRPELPPGVDPPPSWPLWYGPVAFLAAAACTALLVAVMLGVAAGLAGADVADPGPTFNLIATLVQDLVLVAVALAFTAVRLRPRAWHFGLRRSRLWPSVGWLSVAVLAFYGFTAAYTALVEPEGEQRIVEQLGAEESTALLIGAAILIVGVAPFAEELFFRAFFYGALRTRLAVLPAALLDGLLFGAIHYSGPATLSILPPLAFLGFTFCLLYERTGSLYPVIAFHALNNAIALSVEVGSEKAAAALIVGFLTIVSCLVLPRAQRRRAPFPLGAGGGAAGSLP